MQPSLTRLGFIVFVSGLCSLVYQVAWLRMLRLVFGSSTTSTAVVLAIFMGGLGLGGVLLGRRAERVRDPLAFYAKIEIGIALVAAASPVLVVLARSLYLALGGVSTLGLPVATLLRLLLAVIVLGVPTTLMGGTLPAVAQAMEKATDRGRRIVATLYGVNTFGAVAGAFLTTFFLIELLGTRQSLWLAAALNLLLGLGVRAMARRLADAGGDGGAAGAEPDVPAQNVAAPAPEDAMRPAAVRVVLVAAFVVGFVFFLMEIVWYRMLTPILGGTSFTFGLILTIALAGIGLGGWMYSRGSRQRRPTLDALAATCALEAFCLVVPFALGDRLAYFALIQRGLAVQGFTALTLGWALVAAIVVLPTAIVAGYQFPMLVALLGAGRERVGPEVGLAYAWNTWGAILGSLAGGFALLPLLTAPRLWRFSAVLLAVVGAVLVALAPRQASARRSRALAIGAGALSLLLCLAPGPSAFWRHSGIGAGRADALVTRDPNQLRNSVFEIRRAVWREAEGIESSVALLGGFDLSLYVNGKSDGSAVGDSPTMIMLGMVGALLHPMPRNALVIGLGSGTTTGWLAQVPEMEQVDVVELEPSVAALADEFAAVSFGSIALPNVRLFAGDGREYVRTSAQTYDMIASQPSNPYRAGVADLYSREFYRAVEKRLRPGGLFVQWLQGYEVDAEVVGIAYATLASVFPHIESWQISKSDLLLVAGREPMVHDLDRLRRRAEQQPFRRALQKTWRVGGLEGYFTGYLGNDGLARLVAQQGHAVSTDDRPLIEYGFARNLGQVSFRVNDLQMLARNGGVDRPEARGTPIDWNRVKELREARQAAGHYQGGEGDGAGLPDDAQARIAARRAYARGNLARAAEAWSSQEAGPMSLLDRWMLAEATLEHDDGGEPDLAELEAEAPTEAALIAARRSWIAGKPEAALEQMTRALATMKEDPWVFEPILRRSLGLILPLASHDRRSGEILFEALEEPFAALRFDEVRRMKRLEIAIWTDFPHRCVAAYEPFEPHVVWEEQFLTGRFLCYRLNGHRLAPLALEQLEQLYADSPRRLSSSPEATAAEGPSPELLRELKEAPRSETLDTPAGGPRGAAPEHP